MSIWTHVAGVIRYDCLIDKEPDTGITCCGADGDEKWDKCDVPCGSEGSLQVSKWTNPSESSVAKYTISIFGDLRDYSSEQEIIDYFDRITKNDFVRQATYTINVEGNRTRVFIWEDVSFKEVF